LKEFNLTLREAYPGRYPNEVCAALQAISTACCVAGNLSLKDRAEVMGFTVSQLETGHKKWEHFLANADMDSLITLLSEIRKNKILDEWLDFLMLWARVARIVCADSKITI